MNNEDRMFHIGNQADAETLAAFNKAVPPKLAREIAGDHISKSTSFPMVPSENPVKPGANWVEPNPITPPQGVAICDAMMAQEDRLWRRELATKLGVNAKPKDAA